MTVMHIIWPKLYSDCSKPLSINRLQLSSVPVPSTFLTTFGITFVIRARFLLSGGLLRHFRHSSNTLQCNKLALILSFYSVSPVDTFPVLWFTQPVSVGSFKAVIGWQMVGSNVVGTLTGSRWHNKSVSRRFWAQYPERIRDGIGSHAWQV